MINRCEWAKDDLMIEYHDNEWGVPVHDDRKLFEFLILDGAQAGLSWYTILKKRDNYWAKDHRRNIGENNFDQIKFIFIEDENQQVMSFMNGDYDIYPWSRAQWWVERFTPENKRFIE